MSHSYSKTASRHPKLWRGFRAVRCRRRHPSVASDGVVAQPAMMLTYNARPENDRPKRSIGGKCRNEK